MSMMTINTLVEDIYASAIHPENWTPTLSRLAQITGYRGIAIVPENTNDDSLKLSSSVDKTPDHEYYTYYININPFRRLRPNLPRYKGLIRDIDLLSPDEIRNSPYYVDFLNKHGCSHTERIYICQQDIAFFLAGQRGKNYSYDKATSEIDLCFFRVI